VNHNSFETKNVSECQTGNAKKNATPSSSIELKLMTNYKRRNAISAHSNSSEALALRTFSQLARTCNNRLPGSGRGESDLFWKDQDLIDQTTEKGGIQDDHKVLPCTAPAA
jgi:hypothetical protein